MLIRIYIICFQAQYSFIYEAILEASICGETEIAIPDFTEQLKLLEKVNLLDEKSVIAKEFEVIYSPIVSPI